MDSELSAFLSSFQASSGPLDSTKSKEKLAAEMESSSLHPEVDSGIVHGTPVVTPITRMVSDKPIKPSSGRLIAVNENYICYAIKGNLIRVIHFVQVTRFYYI